MNRFEADVILEYNFGWHGYEFDDPYEEADWDSLVDDMCEKYRNKNEAYRDGYEKPDADFWNARVRR